MTDKASRITRGELVVTLKGDRVTFEVIGERFDGRSRCGEWMAVRAREERQLSTGCLPGERRRREYQTCDAQQ